MAVNYNATVWCDGRDQACMRWEEVGQVTAAQARQEVAKLGWTQRRIEGKLVDLCPGCSREAPGK